MGGGSGGSGERFGMSEVFDVANHSIPVIVGLRSSGHLVQMYLGISHVIGRGTYLGLGCGTRLPTGGASRIGASGGDIGVA